MINITGTNYAHTGGHIKGECHVCGDNKQYKSKNPKYYKPYYFKLFIKGTDEYLGMYCNPCLDNFIREALGLTSKEK